MSTLNPSNQGHGEDRGQEVLIVLWVCYSVTILVFVLRLFTRWRVTRNLGFDDFLIALSLILGLVSASLATVSTRIGLGQHDRDIPPSQTLEIVKQTTINVPFCLITALLPKFAVMILLSKIMGPATRGLWILKVLLFGLAIFTALTFAFSFFQCIPLRGLWNPFIPSSCRYMTAYLNLGVFTGGISHLLKAGVFSVDFSVALSAFTDVVLALFPISIMWNLQMKRQKKIAICSIMGLGIFAGAAAAFKTSELHRLTPRSDFPWDVVALYIWTCLEINLIVICACLPTIPPLVRRLRENDFRMVILPLGRKKGLRADNTDEEHLNEKPESVAYSGVLSV